MSTLTTPPVVDARGVPTAEVLTPTVRRSARRAGFWIAALVFILLVAGITFAVAGSTANSDRLAADNPGPAGAQALVEVLRAHGVTVVQAPSLAAVRSASSNSASTTVALYDPNDLLDDGQLQSLSGYADHVVLLDPTLTELRALLPDASSAGVTRGTATARCSIGWASRAGTITAKGTGLRILAGSSDAVGCFPTRAGVYSVVSGTADQQTVTAVGATDALTNNSIIQKGDAALGIGLFGQTKTLIWYLPTLADIGASGPPTLAEFAPKWLTPGILLALVVFLVAAFWRARRLGPLVVENLPVTVRASETMEGRARLYEKSSARLRALDALRVGAIDRLATALRLPRSSQLDQIVAAVAEATRRPLPEVRGILVDSEPSSDVELVGLSDELLVLERAVEAAVRPG